MKNLHIKGKALILVFIYKPILIFFSLTNFVLFCVLLQLTSISNFVFVASKKWTIATRAKWIQAFISTVKTKYFLHSEKNPMSKFSLRSSLIDLYEQLFLIHRYIFNQHRKYFLLTFLLFKIFLLILKKILLSRKQSKFWACCIKCNLKKTKR